MVTDNVTSDIHTDLGTHLNTTFLRRHNFTLNPFFVIIPPILLDTEITENNVNAANNSLNGFQAFCQSSALQECRNRSVLNCPTCNVGLYGFFIALVFALGLVVLLGNTIILWTALRRRKISKFDLLKASLAVADILAGAQLLFVSIPKIAWSLHASADDMLDAVLSSSGTPAATSGGIFFVLGFTSSLFNLLLMSAQRLYAISFPMRYKLLSKHVVLVGVVLAWGLAIFAAAIPAMFPATFVYSYNHVLYLYYATTTVAFTSKSHPDFTAQILMMVFFYALPFLMMVAFVVATAIHIRVFMRKKRNKMGFDSQRTAKERVGKVESSAFVTVLFMIIGFTLTLLPVIIVATMFYAGILNQNNYEIPYLAGFYLSLSSSLVNIVVYCIRNDRYRKTIGHLFCFWREKEQLDSFTGVAKQTTS